MIFLIRIMNFDGQQVKIHYHKEYYLSAADAQAKIDSFYKLRSDTYRSEFEIHTFYPSGEGPRIFISPPVEGNNDERSNPTN